MNEEELKDIAEIIKIHKDTYGGEQDNLSRILGDYFEKKNKTCFGDIIKFDKKQFLKDCGVEE